MVNERLGAGIVGFWKNGLVVVGWFVWMLMRFLTSFVVGSVIVVFGHGVMIGVIVRFLPVLLVGLCMGGCDKDVEVDSSECACG
jgi:hypothetical protein